jgi:hypothetical protein
MVAIHRLLKLSKLRQVLLSRGKPNIDTGGELSSCLFNSLRWVATLNFERSGPRPAPPSRDALAECVLHKLTSEQRGAQLFVVAENAVFRQLTMVGPGASDPHLGSKAWPTTSREFRPGKNCSICEENSVQRRFGITPIVCCPSSIGSESTP